MMITFLEAHINLALRKLIFLDGVPLSVCLSCIGLRSIVCVPLVSNDIRTKKLTLSDPSHIVTVNICHTYVGAQLFDLDI